MTENRNMGFWEFLHQNKTLKILLSLLLCVIIFSIIYFISKGYSLETKFGSLKPPQKETNKLPENKITVDTGKLPKVIEKKFPQKIKSAKKIKSAITVPDSTKVNTPAINPQVINVTSNNQSGGITANQVFIGAKKPKLLDIDKIKILAIAMDKDENIQISCLPGSNNSYELAEQIRSFLVEKGYKKVSSIGMFVSSNSFSGVTYDRRQKGRLNFQVGRIEDK